MGRRSIIKVEKTGYNWIEKKNGVKLTEEAK